MYKILSVQYHSTHGFFKNCRYWLFGILSFVILSSCGIKKSLNDRPDLSGYTTSKAERTKLNDSTFISENGFLTKNQQGIYELYVKGNPLERGLAIGSLTEELMYRQEQVFFEKVNSLVPSERQQKLLTKFLRWYNRKIYKHIPEDYKSEIYGLTRYASSDFNSIAPPYLRSLYLHGAHDIGHALKDLMLVGCTSFAVWGENSEDGELLIGRNFDFYAGDEFAENKIIAFVKPDKGHKFMSVTWGGFIGIVSGMNDQGLTVTINAGKSKIPLVAKTPISILTREILQYASTIDEAVEIAKKREVFVSESIMIGSAKDGKAALIEVAPTNFGVYEVENTAKLICSNHFQSEAYEKDKRNLKTIEESHTQYRFDRMNELLTEEKKINPTAAVAILRNRKGLHDTELGFGNEKALNQLLAHHGIVFQPSVLKVWVSSNPYQLGEFVGYDLTEEFKRLEVASERWKEKSVINIPLDPFLKTEEYKNYEAYRELETKIELEIELERNYNTRFEVLTQLNPEYWKAHYLLGKYYYNTEKYNEAVVALSEASKKEIPSMEEKKLVEKYLRKANRKAK